MTLRASIRGMAVSLMLAGVLLLVAAVVMALVLSSQPAHTIPRSQCTDVYAGAGGYFAYCPSPQPAP